MMQKLRLNWVDNFKGIGIILILLGHCAFPQGSTFLGFIFSFHVVLFFFISGFLFNIEKIDNFFGLLKNKFVRLMVPYFLFNFIMIGYFKAKEYFFGIEYYLSFNNFLKGLFYGSFLPGNKEIVLINVSTWFLISLFLISLFYYIVSKVIKNDILKLFFLLSIAILIFIKSLYFNFRMPFCIDISLMGSFFYGVGNIFKDKIIKLVDKIDFKYMFLLPIIVIGMFLVLNSVNFSTNYYGYNFIYFLANSFLGIILVLILSKLIPKNPVLSFYGQNSIYFLGFEWIKVGMLIFLVSKFPNFFTQDNSYFNGFIEFILISIVIGGIIFGVKFLIPLLSIKIPYKISKYKW